MCSLGLLARRPSSQSVDHKMWLTMSWKGGEKCEKGCVEASFWLQEGLGLAHSWRELGLAMVRRSRAVWLLASCMQKELYRVGSQVLPSLYLTSSFVWSSSLLCL